MINSIKQDEVVLSNNSKYVITHWSMSETIRRLPLYGTVFGSSFSLLLQSGENGEDLGIALPEAIHTFFSFFQENGSDDLIKGIFDSTSTKSPQGGLVPVNIDEHFDGDISLVIELMIKVLDLHYGSLFKGKALSGFLTMSRQMATQVPTSPA